MKEVTTLLSQAGENIMAGANVTHWSQLSSIPWVLFLGLALYFLTRNSKDSQKSTEAQISFAGEINPSFTKIFTSKINNLRGKHCIRVDIFIDVNKDASPSQIKNLEKYLDEQKNIYSDFKWFVYIPEEQEIGDVLIYKFTVSLREIPELEEMKSSGSHMWIG